MSDANGDVLIAGFGVADGEIPCKPTKRSIADDGSMALFGLVTSAFCLLTSFGMSRILANCLI